MPATDPSLADPAAGRRTDLAPALFVHPHPDDEAIACGGTIAAEVARGRRVVLVTCTGGEAGDNQSGIDLGGREMGDVRRDEMAAALRALGDPEHHWLGYRDSGMAVDEAGRVVPVADLHAEAFHLADLEEAAGRLAAIIREVRPAVVVSDDEAGTYGHPDHVKANAVTARAVELAADPGWGDGQPWRVARRVHHTLSHERMVRGHHAMLEEGLASPFGDAPIEDPSQLPFGVPGASVTTVVDVTDHLAAKRAAIRAHASQVGPDSFFLNVPDALERDFFGAEEYVIVDGDRADGDDADLFAGLDAA